MSELPLLEQALRDAAERRYRGPWWRPEPRRGLAPVVLGALAAAIAFVLVSLLAGSGPAGTDERPAARPADRWTATLNEAHGFDVSLPPGWALSDASLTPQLLDPASCCPRAVPAPLPQRQLQPHARRCAQGNGSCRRVRIDPGTRPQRGSVSSGFPPRPSSFAERAKPERTDLDLCLDVKPHPVAYWMPFSDAGRRFYALLVLGREAPASTRAEAFAILDRIRFDPAVKPTGIRRPEQSIDAPSTW